MLFGSRLNKLATSIRRALSEYAVLGINPPFVADFIEKKYLTGGASSTFSNAINHARAGNATMTDGYGPELVTNGGFDSDLSGWTDTNSHWSVVDGRAYHASSSAYNPLSLTLSLSGTYILTFDAEVISASNTAHLLVDGTSTQLLANGSDSYSVFITDATTIVFSREPGSTAEFYIDNVSVREMPAIKWGPHNLVANSEDLTGSGWTTRDSGAVIDAETFSVGTGSLDDVYTSGTLFSYSGESATAEFDLWSETDSGSDITAILNVGGGSNVVQTITLNNTPTRYTLTSGSFSSINSIVFRSAGTALTAKATKISAYRSDLGGMVDNPERGDSYVPTTSSDKYLPRIGHHVYNGSAWVNEGVLAESESRTNLVTYSEDFTDSSWTTSASSVTKKTGIVAPDGSENVYHFQEDTNNFQHQLTTNLTAGTQVFSVFAKGDGSGRYLKLYGYGLGTAGEAPVFDVDNGIVYEPPTQTHFLSASIQDVGNGWYRCSLRADTDAGTGDPAFALVNATNSHATVGYTGDGTSGVYLYGAQLEATSGQASSYIPTSGSTVTRAAESFTIPSANLPWPTPQIIGSDLVDNGDFSTDSDWTKNAGWSIESGVATYTNTGSNSEIVQTISGLTVGNVYQISVNIISNGSSIRLRAASPSAVITPSNITGTGEATLVFTAAGSNESIRVRANAGGDVTIDNVSVREINPLSVSIAMDGRSTFADEGNTRQHVRWYEDSQTAILISQSTSSSKTGQHIFYQESGNVIDQITTAGNYYTPDINVPFNVASRHGSTFINGATDGVALTEDTSPTSLPDLETADLSLAHDFQGTIGTFRVWDKDLGDDGIVEATNPSLEPSLSLTFEGIGTNSFVVNDWSE